MHFSFWLSACSYGSMYPKHNQWQLQKANGGGGVRSSPKCNGDSTIVCSYKQRNNSLTPTWKERGDWAISITRRIHSHTLKHPSAKADISDRILPSTTAKFSIKVSSETAACVAQECEPGTGSECELVQVALWCSVYESSGSIINHV